MTTKIHTFRATTSTGTLEVQAPDHATAWTTARAMASAKGANVLHVEQVLTHSTAAPPPKQRTAPVRAHPAASTDDIDNTAVMICNLVTVILL